MVATRRGVRSPDVAPRPAAWCPACGEQVRAVQAWKNPRRPKIGKYRQQYVYRCPNAACRHTAVEPYVLPAAAAIDWGDLGMRVGDRTRPLAPATIRRIRAGLAMFAQPVTVGGGNTWQRPSGYACPPFLTLLRSGRHRTIGVDEPLATIVTSGSNHGLVVPADGTGNHTPATTGEPLRTRTTRETDGPCAPPFIAELRRNCDARPVHDPLSTVTAAGNHHGLVVPFVVANHGGTCDPRHTVKPAGDPLSPVTTRDPHALVIPYRRTTRPATTGEPLGTVSTRDHAALLRPAVEVEDCSFRMLKPREHLRAQRFPDTYIVTGNNGEQTMQAGNAVSANVAQWLGERLAEVLS